MDNSILKLQSCKPLDVSVYNDESMPPIIHLLIPDESLNINIIDLVDLDNSSEYIPSCILNKSGKWIDIESKHLSKDPGYHRYRISGQCKSESVYLYFSYRIQSDNPDKPYIYMRRGVSK